jgi:hypothetical protein
LLLDNAANQHIRYSFANMLFGPSNSRITRSPPVSP